MERNLTKGNLLKTIIYFSLPYFLSYFLQTLYGLADLFIIGQFCGVEATTAVTVGSQIMHMLTVMIVGLAMGATVMIGRSVGANDKKACAKYIGNTATLFMLVSICATAVLLILTKVILRAVNTPGEAFSQAQSYLTICFIGVPFITAYNIISAIFRGLGDSKSPMYFIAISCAANIALDYLFIGALGLGSAGAALGTALSQTISVIFSLFFIKRSKSSIKLCKSDFRLAKPTVSKLVKIGLPVSLQDGLIQISFLVITAIANSRGLNDAAAVGIVEKIIGILFLVPSTMLSTVSAVSSQCVGAKMHERAKNTLKYGIIINFIWGLMCVLFMHFFARQTVSLFTQSQEVAVLGQQYMAGYVYDCIIAGTHFCFSGYFCAYGLSQASFFHNVISTFCARIPLAYLASVNFPDTLTPMGIATTLGSSVSVFICIAIYIYMQKKKIKST